MMIVGGVSGVLIGAVLRFVQYRLDERLLAYESIFDVISIVWQDGGRQVDSGGKNGTKSGDRASL